MQNSYTIMMELVGRSFKSNIWNEKVILHGLQICGPELMENELNSEASGA